MKLHLMSPSALMLLHASDVQSKHISSPDQLINLSGLSDYTDAGDRKDMSAITFGTSLFAELCTETPNGNVLLSPLSIYNALTLVRDGSTVGSENEAELKRVLGPPFSVEQTDEEEDGSSGVHLSMASSIWTNSLKQSYVDGVRKKHSADAFSMPKRYTDVDTWIEEKTNGMIKGFLGNGEIESTIMALLVNAVYFKGSWTYEFDPEKTVDGEFEQMNGESKLPARFMTATREMQFIEKSPQLGGASVVLLDYGKATSTATEYTSLFILPLSPGTGSMNDAISGLKSQPMSDLNLLDTRKTKVELKLPRFRLKVGLSAPIKLKSPLENMGMKIAFDSHIDGKFGEMSYDPTLYVEDVLHGAVMEVTEEGTEAAAVTVVPMRNRSLPRPPPRLTFDRPFVVAVVHRATGTPVFIGRVEEPELVF